MINLIDKLNHEVYVKNHIQNYSFYIPFTYNYNVRLGTILKLFSWIFIFIVPTFYYSLLNVHGSLSFWVGYLFLLFTVFNLYELGYIENDTETIKREKNGSVRLYAENLQHYEKNKVIIFNIRILLAVVTSVLVYIYNPQIMGTFIGLLFAWLIPIVFHFYNKIRKRKVIYLHFVLVNLRYFSFLMLSYPFIEVKYVILLYVTFPLINWIERFTVPRYNYKFIKYVIPSISFLTYSRIIYYLLVSITVSIFLFYDKLEWYDVILIYIYFVYRLSIAFILLIKRPKNYLVMK